MRIGVSAAQGGRLANPAALRGAALAAEQLGYSSVWAGDGRPGCCQPWLDPVAVLGAVAAFSGRARLGLAVLAGGSTDPAALGRSLASLDVVSDGRLTVALAAGAPSTTTLDDVVDGLDAAWARSPAPVQRPRPPLLLGGTTPADLERVARRGDGWHAAGVPVELLGPMWRRVQDLAADAGRDAGALELVVRVDLVLLDRPVPGARTPYTGALAQVADDLDATRRAGASEVVLGFSGDVGFDEALDAYARVTEAAGATALPSRARAAVTGR